MLALVFNVTNVIGFTYACVFCTYIFYLVLTAVVFFLTSDRDSKKRWAPNWSMGGLGGQMFTGMVKNNVGRVFGS